MKVKEIKDKEFKPIKLEITIEDKDELIDLWLRIHISASMVEDYYKHKESLKYISSVYDARNGELRTILNKHLRNYEQRKTY